MFNFYLYLIFLYITTLKKLIVGVTQICKQCKIFFINMHRNKWLFYQYFVNRKYFRVNISEFIKEFYCNTAKTGTLYKVLYYTFAVKVYLGLWR